MHKKYNSSWFSSNELYKATQKTLDPDSMQSRIARDRQLDRERAERRLAEEQRLRDMIQSMLPPPAETVEPPEEFIPLPDPWSYYT